MLALGPPVCQPCSGGSVPRLGVVVAGRSSRGSGSGDAWAQQWQCLPLVSFGPPATSFCCLGLGRGGDEWAEGHWEQQWQRRQMHGQSCSVLGTPVRNRTLSCPSQRFGTPACSRVAAGRPSRRRLGVLWASDAVVGGLRQQYLRGADAVSWVRSEPDTSSGQGCSRRASGGSRGTGSSMPHQCSCRRCFGPRGAKRWALARTLPMQWLGCASMRPAAAVTRIGCHRQHVPVARCAASQAMWRDRVLTPAGAACVPACRLRHSP